MKAIVTAGGLGTRLRSLPKSGNKHLLLVGQKPVIFYALENIARAKIVHVGIAINSGDDKVKQVVGDGQRFGTKVTYIEAGPSLDLPEIITRSQEFIGRESFVFYLGDNLLENGIQHFVNDYSNQSTEPDCYLVLAETKHLERYGVAEISDADGRIFRITEKPKEPKGKYAVTGVSIYSSRVFEAIQRVKASYPGELTISNVHQFFLDNDFKVTHSFVDGWWKDIGEDDDFMSAERLLPNNSTACQIARKADNT